MNKENKELVIELCSDLFDMTYKFLKKIPNVDDRGTSELLNIILSSYLSAMTNSMKIVAKGNKEIEKNVKDFMSYLLLYMQGHDIIKDINLG
jgi:hypothetical protein